MRFKLIFNMSGSCSILKEDGTIVIAENVVPVWAETIINLLNNYIKEK